MVIMDDDDAIKELKDRYKQLLEASMELFVVAERRGDNCLPNPADDPALWTARMQDAWGELEDILGKHALEELDNERLAIANIEKMV